MKVLSIPLVARKAAASDFRLAGSMSLGRLISGLGIEALLWWSGIVARSLLTRQPSATFGLSAKSQVHMERLMAARERHFRKQKTKSV